MILFHVRIWLILILFPVFLGLWKSTNGGSNVCLSWSLSWQCLCANVDMYRSVCMHACVKQNFIYFTSASAWSLLHWELPSWREKGGARQRDSGPEQGLLTGGETRSKGSFGPGGTSKHSSFATEILFSHHFNFKEPSGCISIWLG